VHDLLLWWLQTLQILITDISQGSVAACLRRGGIFIDHFIANLLESAPMTELLKSVNI